jgi:hypothetical protein
VIEDKIFGKLEYDNIWNKDTTINFFGNETEIVLMIEGEEDGKFEDGQYEAYQALIQNWDELHKRFPKLILEYYEKRRRELGYAYEVNKDYPLVETEEQILEMITLVGITVSYAELYGGRSIGITFDCTWDTENGVGLRVNNEEVIEIGAQDITM